MLAVAYDPIAANKQIFDGCIVGRENPGVEYVVVRASDQRRVVCIQHNEVCGCANGEGRHICAACPGAAMARVIDEAARRASSAGRHAIAGAVTQTLRIFKCAQFVGERDADVAIAAHAVCAAGRRVGDAFENAIAEIGLGDRAQTGDGTGCGQSLGFVWCHVCAVDEAPALIDADAVEQDFYGPGAECGLHLLDLAHLFGGVDVDRAAGCQRDQVFDLGKRCGAQ